MVCLSSTAASGYFAKRSETSSKEWWLFSAPENFSPLPLYGFLQVFAKPCRCLYPTLWCHAEGDMFPFKSYFSLLSYKFTDLNLLSDFCKAELNYDLNTEKWLNIVKENGRKCIEDELYDQFGCFTTLVFITNVLCSFT